MTFNNAKTVVDNYDNVVEFLSTAHSSVKGKRMYKKLVENKFDMKVGLLSLAITSDVLGVYSTHGSNMMSRTELFTFCKSMHAINQEIKGLEKEALLDELKRMEFAEGKTLSSHALQRIQRLACEEAASSFHGGFQSFYAQLWLKDTLVRALDKLVDLMNVDELTRSDGLGCEVVRSEKVMPTNIGNERCFSRLKCIAERLPSLNLSRLCQQTTASYNNVWRFIIKLSEAELKSALRTRRRFCRSAIEETVAQDAIRVEVEQDRHNNVIINFILTF